MPNPHEPEHPVYEERLRARERASKRAWTDEQRRRVVDAGQRARAQRRHDWRHVDPSAVDPRPQRADRPASLSPSDLLALEVAGAGLGALHLMLGAFFVALAWSPPVPGRVWVGAAGMAFVVAILLAFSVWPADRRLRAGLSHPVERLLAGFAAGSAAGLLVPALWSLSSTSF